MFGIIIRENIKRLQNLPNTRFGRVLGALRLTRGYAPWPPLYVELALTYHCNLSCEYCYQAPARHAAAQEMRFEDLRRIERGIRSSFAIRPRLYLFGGEPMAHPDFLEILRWLTDRGYRVSFTTNGTLLEPCVEEVARTRGIDNLVISLNTANLRTAPRLASELIRLSKGSGMTVSLNCPVDLAAEAGLDLVEIVHQVEGCGARFLSFQHSQSVFLRGRSVDVGTVVEQIRNVRALPRDTEITFFPDIRDRDLEAYYSDPEFPGHGPSCVLPWFDVFVRPNGDVAPCDEIDEILGNAARQPLGEIWNSERFRNFRRGSEGGKREHAICRRCCHRKYYR